MPQAHPSAYWHKLHLKTTLSSLPVACQVPSLTLRAMQVKKSALRLIEAFVDKCEDPDLVATKFVPAIMDPILGDYASNVPDARSDPPQLPAVLETMPPSLVLWARNDSLQSTSCQPAAHGVDT